MKIYKIESLKMCNVRWLNELLTRAARRRSKGKDPPEQTLSLNQPELPRGTKYLKIMKTWISRRFFASTPLHLARNRTRVSTVHSTAKPSTQIAVDSLWSHEEPMESKDDWYVSKDEPVKSVPKWQRALQEAQNRINSTDEHASVDDRPDSIDTRNTNEMSKHELLKASIDIISDLYPTDVSLIEVNTEFAQYMVVVEGKTPRHLYQMADSTRALLKKHIHHSISLNSDVSREMTIQGVINTNAIKRAKRREARGTLSGLSPTVHTTEQDWLVLDAGEIIYHFMMPDAAAKYDLPGLYSLEGQAEIQRATLDRDEAPDFDLQAWRKLRTKK